ncbi:divalent-cation tolerance protein CutA [Chloroflexota bacterium]
MGMEESAYIVLFITAADAEEARQISRLLLERRKAACINIIPRVDSNFWWEDKLDSAQESLLIIKTKTSLLPEITDLVKGVHSNAVPEIIALPIIGGNQEYLQWIDNNVS